MVNNLHRLLTLISVNFPSILSQIEMIYILHFFLINLLNQVSKL